MSYLKSSGVKQQTFYYAHKLCGRNSHRAQRQWLDSPPQLSWPQWGWFQRLGGLEAPSFRRLVSLLWWLEGCVLLDFWLEKLYMTSIWTSLSMTAMFGRGAFRDWVFQVTKGKLCGILWPCFRRHISSLLPHAISWSVHKPSQIQGEETYTLYVIGRSVKGLGATSSTLPLFVEGWKVGRNKHDLVWK